MLQTLSYIINVAPEGVPQVVKLSQNENGRTLAFTLTGAGTVNIPSGSTVTISGTKPDGVVYSATGTLSGNVASFNEDTQMTAVSGIWPAKIKVTYSGQTIATCKVVMAIDPDPVAPGSVPSSSQLNGLVAEAQQYATYAKYEAFGSPLVAATAAAMTDKTRVYVYTGTETGKTAGHWYYWNGSAWTDGGVYNSQGINTDTTLTLSGMAADSKATGDQITGLKSDLQELEAGGYVADQQRIEEKIDAWLDDHPEATTTVQDGSLTEAKFSNALKLKAIKDYVTPEMFGAVGDGVTYDTAAVQSAINHCQAHGTYLLLTKYYLVGGLNIPFDGLLVQGIGRNSGFIKGTNENLFSTTLSGVFYFTLRDFRIVGNNTQGAALYSSNTNRLSSFLIDNIVVTSCTTAFSLRDTYVSKITNCLIDSCGTAFDLYDCNAINIMGCSANACGKGLYIEHNSTCINFDNNTVQSCENAILVYACEQLKITGNYFEYNENNNYAIVHIDAASSRNARGVTIIGNRFAPQGSQGTTLPIKLIYVTLGFIVNNVFSNYYNKFLDIDSNSSGVTYDYSIQSKYTNASNYCHGITISYIEGVASNAATSIGTMAWDRYRSKPIWWNGSNWIYADGSART